MQLNFAIFIFKRFKLRHYKNKNSQIKISEKFKLGFMGSGIFEFALSEPLVSYYHI